jgi:hypothetical protein
MYWAAIESSNDEERLRKKILRDSGGVSPWIIG